MKFLSTIFIIITVLSFSHAKDINHRIHDCNLTTEDKIWKELSQENTIEAYNVFIQAFPKSDYIALANYKISKLKNNTSFQSEIEEYKNRPYWVKHKQLKNKNRSIKYGIAVVKKSTNIQETLAKAENLARETLNKAHMTNGLDEDKFKTEFYTTKDEVYALVRYFYH